MRNAAALIALLASLVSSAHAATVAGSRLHDQANPARSEGLSQQRARQLTSDSAIADAIRSAAHPLTGASSDYDALLRRIGDSRIVLLGEDTHGTREFYVERARITRRLIEERGFAALVIEADLSETAGLHRFLRQENASIDAAMRTFTRFPRWMWGNTDFRDLVTWLREFNSRRAAGLPPVLIHGMDLNEIQPAMLAVIAYLESRDIEAAGRARSRYSCLDTGDAMQSPAGGAGARWPEIDCAGPVQEQLSELIEVSAAAGSRRLDLSDPAFIHALQSARLVRDAQQYYRAQRIVPDVSWNLRDTHMAAGIDLLLAHLDAASGTRSRIVVWAHNAHLGDARETARGDAGILNVGQLLRERYPGDVITVGLMSGTGIVRAATDWGGPDLRKRLRPPLPGSHAALMRASGGRRFYLDFESAPVLRGLLDAPRPQRGVGVRYLPALEREGHYYTARLARQFDALIYIDQSSPLQHVPR